MNAATDTPNRITGKDWHATPFALLSDPRRVGVPKASMWTLIELMLAAHRDMKLRERSHDWASRDHIRMTLGEYVPAEVDDLVAAGFLEEDEYGIRIPDDEWYTQVADVRSDPTGAERKRRQREKEKAEAGNRTTNGAKPEGLLRQTLREQLGAMALSEPGTQAMARLDGLEPQHVLESARAFTNGVGGSGIVSGDYLAENVAKNLKRGQAATA